MPPFSLNPQLTRHYQAGVERYAVPSSLKEENYPGHLDDTDYLEIWLREHKEEHKKLWGDNVEDEPIRWAEELEHALSHMKEVNAKINHCLSERSRRSQARLQMQTPGWWASKLDPERPTKAEKLRRRIEKLQAQVEEQSNWSKLPLPSIVRPGRPRSRPRGGSSARFQSCRGHQRKASRSRIFVGRASIF